MCCEVLLQYTIHNYPDIMKDVINGLFPANANNHYQGPKLALIIFAILLVPLTVRSLIHMFKDDSGAMSIATIPLDTYPTGAANTIIAYQAHVGIDQFLLCFVYMSILFRYRSLLPLGYLLITLEFGIGIIIMGSGWKMMELRGTAPGYITMWILPFVTSLMCWFTLPERRN